MPLQGVSGRPTSSRSGGDESGDANRHRASAPAPSQRGLRRQASLVANVDGRRAGGEAAQPARSGPEIRKPRDIANFSDRLPRSRRHRRKTTSDEGRLVSITASIDFSLRLGAAEITRGTSIPPSQADRRPQAPCRQQQGGTHPALPRKPLCRAARCSEIPTLHVVRMDVRTELDSVVHD
jgi:hypothetical protein